MDEETSIVSSTTEDQPAIVSDTTDDKTAIVSSTTEDQPAIVSDTTDDKTAIVSSTTDDKPAIFAIVSNTTDDKKTIVPSTTNKTAVVSSTTVGPSCFRDDRKQVVKKRPRFPLFRGPWVKSRSSSKTLDKSSNDKNNTNNVDQSPAPQCPVNFGSNPNSPSSLSTPHSTLRKYASANNLQDLANMAMSPSPSTDNLQEAGGTMSPSASPYDLSDLQTTRHKHSVSTGNIPEMTTKGMSYSKSTSNLQDLKLGMRRYASALNLLDLDINEQVDVEEDGDHDKALENCDGDVMIDDKADQFIAQFYQQMKSQHNGRPAKHYY
ncbi:hypothetical protein POM88_050147 [Heracleum sosnowskyi]|uniref:Uncharacterized protein n=1 Tax=Heracleum sosnowskyi TaxID=360622 RepID=A0AAD8GZR2_9APIA|nr:hypothetical protein POM88_050147 [Heracleum sosnowskyi]